MTKDELIKKHQDCNVEHDWWDYMEADLIEQFQAQGVSVSGVQFTGFWSQGDGASFVCCVSGEGWPKFLEAYPQFAQNWPALVALGSEHVTFNMNRGSSRYSHECMCWGDLEVEPPDDPEELTAPTMPDYMRWRLYEDADWKGIERDLHEFFRDQMRDYYERLEKEYEYLTSDEVVWETLEANDYFGEEYDAEPAVQT